MGVSERMTSFIEPGKVLEAIENGESPIARKRSRSRAARQIDRMAAIARSLCLAGTWRPDLVLEERSSSR